MSKSGSGRYAGFNMRRTGSPLIRVVLLTLIIVIGLLAILPITQWLSARNDKRSIRSVDTVSLPPPEPPPPEPPPPPEEEEQEDAPELESDPPMMDISMLESMLTPGMGGVVAGGLSLDTVDLGSSIEEAIFFSLADLDRRPDRIQGSASDIDREIPVKYKQSGINIDIRVGFEIGPQGYVSIFDIKGTNDLEISDAIRRAVAKWRFTPPTVDGEAVSARYVQRIELNYGG